MSDDLLDEATLDGLRHIGDPAIDTLVRSFGREIWAVNAQLRHIHKNAERPDLSGPLAAYCAELTLPDVDHRRLANAQRFASRHLIPITTALFCASLPSAYAAAKGARVLVATGRMSSDALDARVNETARFVLDVLAEDGFGPTGSALRAIQKVRLMHASVRVHLLEKGVLADEVPINQEDMLGTLFTFSVVVVRSLRKLGVELRADEAEDFYYLWRAVGQMLGIQPALLPPDLTQAEDLYRRINERQAAASPQGQALMHALILGMERHVPFTKWVPPTLVRHLLGPRLSDLLAVPAANPHLISLLPRPPRAVIGLISPLIARPLLNGIVQWKLGARTAEFAMPEPLGGATSAARR